LTKQLIEFRKDRREAVSLFLRCMSPLLAQSGHWHRFSSLGLPGSQLKLNLMDRRPMAADTFDFSHIREVPPRANPHEHHWRLAFATNGNHFPGMGNLMNFRHSEAILSENCPDGDNGRYGAA
jgi:hypothetical protein